MVGGSLRLQQTLTSCVAPLEEFTSLRQPVKGGNTILITISRTKLLHETARLHSPRPTWLRADPFFLDLRIILPSSTTLCQFRMKQDVRRAATRRLWEFSEYCVSDAFNNLKLCWQRNHQVTNCNYYHILIFNNNFIADSFAKYVNID